MRKEREIFERDPEILFSNTGYNRFLTPEGYPAVEPPWGTLNAIDLNKGEIIWQVPLGEFKELKEKGIAATGTENYGGVVATQGGVVFVAASRDEKIRAFDNRSGKVLWEHQLPAGGYATPAVYEVEGKQFVVIACGGGKMGTKSGDSYIAFSLP
jgi:quinoprotein glucose dehydrogenase